MQPIPVLDYAPSKGNPLLDVYRSLRRPALVLSVGLLGGLVGVLLEAPTCEATGYVQVNLSTPIDIRTLETEERAQLQWIRESAIPAVAWESVTADLLPESRLIVIRATDPDPAHAIEKIDRLIKQVVGRPGLSILARPGPPVETRTFIPAGAAFIVAALAAILALLLRRRPSPASVRD